MASVALQLILRRLLFAADSRIAKKGFHLSWRTEAAPEETTLGEDGPTAGAQGKLLHACL